MSRLAKGSVLINRLIRPNDPRDSLAGRNLHPVEGELDATIGITLLRSQLQERDKSPDPPSILHRGFLVLLDFFLIRGIRRLAAIWIGFLGIPIEGIRSTRPIVSAEVVWQVVARLVFLT